MTELSVLEYAQFYNLASEDKHIDIERILHLFSSQYNRSRPDLLDKNSQTDMMARCEELRRAYSALRSEDPLETTATTLEVINSATSSLSKQDMDHAIHSEPTSLQRAQLQKLPLPFLTIGGGSVDRDVQRVRKLTNESWLFGIEGPGCTANETLDMTRVEVEEQMNAAQESINTAISNAKLSLSIEAMRLLAYNQRCDLPRTPYPGGTNTPICLQNDTGQTFHASEQEASPLLAERTFSSHATDQKKLTRKRSGQNIARQLDPVTSRHQKRKTLNIAPQSSTGESIRTRTAQAYDDEPVAELEGPLTKKTKHLQSSVQSNWNTSKDTEPPLALGKDDIEAQGWPTDTINIESPEAEKENSPCIHNERDAPSAMRGTPDKLPLPIFSTGFVVPRIEMDALIDRCVEASPRVQTSCRNLTELITPKPRCDNILHGLLSEKLETRSTLLESALRPPHAAPRSQDSLRREPGILILNTTEHESNHMKFSDTDELRKPDEEETGGTYPCSSRKSDTKPYSGVEAAHKARDHQSSSTEQGTSLKSKAPLSSISVSPDRRNKPHRALHHDSTLSPYFTPRIEKVSAQVARPHVKKELLREHEPDVKEVFSASSSLSCFLDLKGKRFRSSPRFDKHEVVDDPIEFTQQSRDGSGPVSDNEITMDEQSSANQVYTPPVQPIQARRVILINNCLLQHKPLLIQFLDHHGGPDLTTVYRDFDQPRTHEADILLEPNKCIIFSHIQALGQRPLPGQKSLSGLSSVHDRIVRLCSSFNTIFVLVHFVISQDASDQTHIQFTQFCQCLARRRCREIVPIWVPCNNVSDVPDNINAWTWKIIKYNACKQSVRSAPGLIQDETQWELFLRKAGINAFAAQVILSSLKSGRSSIDGQQSESQGLRRLVQLSKADLVRTFSRMVDVDVLHKFHDLMQSRC